MSQLAHNSRLTSMEVPNASSLGPWKFQLLQVFSMDSQPPVPFLLQNTELHFQMALAGIVGFVSDAFPPGWFILPFAWDETLTAME